MINSDEVKWSLPGWRIEQKFDTSVLIGNWNEERRKFERGDSHFNSTHRTDFKNYGPCLPDVKIRRDASLRQDGLGKQFLFNHHGDSYNNLKISWYDQQFNGREKQEGKLPPLRSWDKHKLSWAPERSDHPIGGTPTNFGLLQKLQDKWKKEAALEQIGTYATTHKLSYIRHPKESFSYKHQATPRNLSSHFHPHRVNKDLHLRDHPSNSPPEYAPNIIVPRGCRIRVPVPTE